MSGVKYLKPVFCVTSFAMRKFERKKIGCLLLLAGFLLGLTMTPTFAQSYRMEMGMATGPSFYMGDANQQRLFDDVRSSWNLLYRYNLNGRFSLKGMAGWTGVAGSTTGRAVAFPNGQDIRFNRRLVDASVQIEMNFYEYGMPDYVPGAARVTPYICAGIGMMGFKTNNVETAAILPYGVGLKVKLFQRINVGCEWSFRQTFTDRLDYAANPGGFYLEDPWLTTSSRNKNNDWYSLFTLNLSVDMFATQAKCFR